MNPREFEALCANLSNENLIWGFRGPNHFLSNFYPVQISRYPTAEHAFVACKTTDPNLQTRIAACRTPGEAKRLGRSFPLREDWDRIKVQAMENILFLKFRVPAMRRLLMATGNKRLVEGNYWHDNFWGECCCPRCEQRPKHNTLGNLLMIVRQTLRNEEVTP